jgi:hypothetical protein
MVTQVFYMDDPDAAVIFFFPIKDWFAFPYRLSRSIIDTPEDEVVATPSQAPAMTATTHVIAPPSLVSPPFRVVAQPMLLIIVMLVSSPTPRLLPFSHRHRH